MTVYAEHLVTDNMLGLSPVYHFTKMHSKNGLSITRKYDVNNILRKMSKNYPNNTNGNFGGNSFHSHDWFYLHIAMTRHNVGSASICFGTGRIMSAIAKPRN